MADIKTEPWEVYYKSLYQDEEIYSRDELVEEIMRLRKETNVRAAIEADSKWISKYKEVNKNCYLLSKDLVEQNKWLKEELLRLQEILNEKTEGIEADKELLNM